MSFLIAGHMRSGTSILRVVCQRHPELEVTREFGNFSAVNTSYPVYRRSILSQWWRRRNGGLIPHDQLGAPTRRLEMFHNLAYVTRYLSHVRRFERGLVTGAVIDQALRRMAPHARQVGDKHPDYALQLEALAGDTTIRCVFLYRDPRDVIASTLEKTRGPWRRGHSDEMRDPARLAGRWVSMMAAMERCRRDLLVVRYEDFVTDPGPALQRLGDWLDVEPSGFDRALVQPGSIGRYRHGLAGQDLSDVVAVAGATMQNYGYS